MTIASRLGLLAAVALLPALAACQPPAAVDTAKEEAAINAQIDAFNAAAKAKDADKMVSMDADDFRGYGGGPDVSGKAADLAGDKALAADPAFAMTVKADHTEVAKSGDLAVQTGTVEFTGTNPQTKAVDHQTAHFVAGWRKDKDGWKLAAVASSPVMAPASPAVPAADPKAPPPAAAPAKK